MSTKNVLMVVGGLMALMGVWSLLVAYASFPEVGFTANLWVALVEVVVGGFAVYTAYSEK